MIGMKYMRMSTALERRNEMRTSLGSSQVIYRVRLETALFMTRFSHEDITISF